MGVRSRVADGLSAISDRRRKSRRRLEEVFGRETLGAVAVINSMFEGIKQVVAGSYWQAAFWLSFMVAAVWAFVNWERVSGSVDKAVEKSADYAEGNDGDAEEEA